MRPQNLAACSSLFLLATASSILQHAAAAFTADSAGFTPSLPSALIPRQGPRCGNPTDKQCTLPNPRAGEDDKFCCPRDTNCIELANGSAGLCCKIGATCGRVQTVQCSSEVSTRVHQEQCGNDVGLCCPKFYTCRSKTCVLKEENWVGLPQEWLATVQFDNFEVPNCTREAQEAVAEFKQEQGDFPIKAILIGLLPGLAGGAFIMFVICYAVHLKRKRKHMYSRHGEDTEYKHENHTILSSIPTPKSIDSRATSRNTNATHRTRNQHSASSGSRHHVSPSDYPRKKGSTSARHNPAPSKVSEEPRSNGPSPHPSHTSRRSRARMMPVTRITPPQDDQRQESPQRNPILHAHPTLPGLYVPKPQSNRTSVSTTTESSASSFQESTISRTRHRNELLYAAHNASPPVPNMPTTPNRLAVLQPVSSMGQLGGGRREGVDATSVITDSEEFAHYRSASGDTSEIRRMDQAYHRPISTGGRGMDRWAKEKAPKPGGGP